MNITSSRFESFIEWIITGDRKTYSTSIIPKKVYNTIAISKFNNRLFLQWIGPRYCTKCIFVQIWRRSNTLTQVYVGLHLNENSSTCDNLFLGLGSQFYHRIAINVNQNNFSSIFSQYTEKITKHQVLCYDEKLSILRN